MESFSLLVTLKQLQQESLCMASLICYIYTTAIHSSNYHQHYFKAETTIFLETIIICIKLKWSGVLSNWQCLHKMWDLAATLLRSDIILYKLYLNKFSLLQLVQAVFVPSTITVVSYIANCLVSNLVSSKFLFFSLQWLLPVHWTKSFPVACHISFSTVAYTTISLS